MHLTNYAINKLSDKFIFNNDEQEQSTGHKRSLSSVFELMRSNGHDIDTLWMRIKDVVIKTLCSGQPFLKH
jgi:tubulin polyglutamylase TTLL6/13